MLGVIYFILFKWNSAPVRVVEMICSLNPFTGIGFNVSDIVIEETFLFPSSESN